MKTLGAIAALVAFVLVVVVMLHVFGVKSLPSVGGSTPPHLEAADAPPLEYVYLDSPRVAAYLGQLEDGLPTSEQRTQELTKSVNASISAGTAAQLSAAEQSQEGTQAVVTPTAADRFYNFMRLLRDGGEASCRVIKRGSRVGSDQCDPNACNGTSRTRWLGEVDADWPTADIVDQAGCIGVGNFVRIAHAQLFLPPFAQVLPRAQNADAVYGELPADRGAFTSLAQSTAVRGGLPLYDRLVRIQRNPRLPFLAAPYGSRSPVGHGVTFFLPLGYAGLTTEPTLLTGSVTVVGKIISVAARGQPYIDYPTISEFGSPLTQMERASPRFITPMKLCATPRDGKQASCNVTQAVTSSVTFNPPVVVILPLAIYQ